MDENEQREGSEFDDDPLYEDDPDGGIALGSAVRGVQKGHSQAPVGSGCLIAALFVFILVAVLLLNGCSGGATPNDPFVGTWKDPLRPDIYLVIEKQGVDYRTTVYRYGKVHPTLGMTSLVFSRDGRHLVGKEYPQPTNGKPNGFFSAPGADLSTSGHLYYSPFGKNVDLTRSSP